MAALIVGLGLFAAKLPLMYIFAVYVYAIVWMFINDQAKLIAYRLLQSRERQSPSHSRTRDKALSKF